MIMVMRLLVSPFRTWELIYDRDPGPLRIFFGLLLPLLLAAVGLEAYVLTRVGESRGFVGVVAIAPELAGRYAIAGIVFGLASVTLAATLMHSVVRGVNLDTNFRRTFAVVGYAFCPIFMAQMMDAIPGLNTWICWAVGIGLGVALLYSGIAHVLRPDQTKGFGLWLVGSFCTIIASGLSHFASVSVLHGRIFR